MVDAPYWPPYLIDVKATVTSKGQITIPWKIRRQLGITSGTVLEFEESAKWLKGAQGG